MNMKCSAGFIISTSQGWLLCHPTNSGNRWDLPKGNIEKDEYPISAAIRELKEETGIDLTSKDIRRIIDIGRFPYLPDKDLHLFYITLEDTSVDSLYCSTKVPPEVGDFYEMDGYMFVPKEDVRNHVRKSLKKYFEKYVEPHFGQLT